MRMIAGMLPGLVEMVRRSQRQSVLSTLTDSRAFSQVSMEVTMSSCALTV